jgi:hypothetical protein
MTKSVDEGPTEKGIIRKYTEEMGIPLATLRIVNEKLKLPEGNLSAFARARRLESVHEAIAWKKGPTQDKREITKVYTVKQHIVAVGKPGKEAAPDYRGNRHYITNVKTNNPNDMNPHIIISGERIEKNLTFGDMFEMVETLMRSDLFGLEILGMQLFRAAFMLDHRKNSEGNWRLSAPEPIMGMLEERIPMVSGIPIRVFICFLDVLALNEDVKVYTLGYADLKRDYGRINTLLTFAHLIAVFLHRRSLAKFAGAFARPPVGMAPLPKTKIALQCFPLLSPKLFEGP